MHLAQTTYSYQASGGAAIVFALIGFAIGIFFVAAYWRIFTKAGEPGWAAIIPIYNTLVALKICGRPWWWLFLFIIPVVNIILLIMLAIDLSKAFGKGGGFAVGMILLPIIFIPILAFGSASYVGTKAY